MGQLAVLPFLFRAQERAALTHVLHLPTTAVFGKDFFGLHRCGGPRIHSAVAINAAGMFRMAQKSLERWREQVVALQECFVDALPVDSLISGGSKFRFPSDWDSPPFVFNLAQAALGEGLPTNICSGLRAARVSLSGRFSSSAVPSDPCRSALPIRPRLAPPNYCDPADLGADSITTEAFRCCKIQKIAYSFVFQACCPGDLRETFIRRLRTIDPEHAWR